MTQFKSLKFFLLSGAVLVAIDSYAADKTPQGPANRLEESRARKTLVESYEKALSLLHSNLNRLDAKYNNAYVKNVLPLENELKDRKAQLRHYENQRELLYEMGMDPNRTNDSIVVLEVYKKGPEYKKYEEAYGAAENRIVDLKKEIEFFQTEIPKLRKELQLAEIAQELRTMDQQLRDAEKMVQEIEKGAPRSSLHRQQKLAHLFERIQDSKTKIFRNLIYDEMVLQGVEDSRLPTQSAQRVEAPWYPDVDQLPRVREKLAALERRPSSDIPDVEVEKQKLMGEYREKIVELEKLDLPAQQIKALQDRIKKIKEAPALAAANMADIVQNYQDQVDLSRMQIELHRADVESAKKGKDYVGSALEAEDKLIDASLSEALASTERELEKAKENVQLEIAKRSEEELKKQAELVARIETRIKRIQNPETESLESRIKFLAPWADQAPRLSESIKSGMLTRTPQVEALLSRSFEASRRKLELEAELAQKIGVADALKEADRRLGDLAIVKHVLKVSDMSDGAWASAVAARADRNRQNPPSIGVRNSPRLQGQASLALGKTREDYDRIGLKMAAAQTRLIKFKEKMDAKLLADPNYRLSAERMADFETERKYKAAVTKYDYPFHRAEKNYWSAQIAYNEAHATSPQEKSAIAAAVGRNVVETKIDGGNVMGEIDNIVPKDGMAPAEVRDLINQDENIRFAAQVEKNAGDNEYRLINSHETAGETFRKKWKNFCAGLYGATN